MSHIPIYVISLADARSRRQKIADHLTRLGLKFEFFDAVRGRELPDEVRRSYNPKGNMTSGEIGCYTSHMRLYEKLVKDNTPLALVLEDDAVLHSDVPALLSKIESVPDFDFCFLGSEDWGGSGFVYRDAKRTMAFAGGFTAYALSSGPWCTHAFLITQAGARRRLACAYPTTTPIDHYQHLSYQPVFYGFYPALAFVNEEAAAGSVSATRWSGWLTRLRSYWWYYPVRDLLKFRPLRRALFLRSAPFRDRGDWRTYETGFKVVTASRLARRVNG